MWYQQRGRLVLPALMAAVFIGMACAAQAQTASTKTRSIAAFKNGLGFFVREGEARLKDGWAATEVVPQAALGTYWIGSSKEGVSIERLVAFQEDVTRTVPAVTIQELMAANVGKRVSLKVGDKEIIQGKLLSVPEDRQPDPLRPTYPVYTSIIPNAQAQVALIETESGIIAVNKNSVQWIEIVSSDGVSTDHIAKEKVKRFRFKVAGARDVAPITIGYLQKGISWSPGYMVDLLDEKKARITMQGLLVNDVEDIEDAEVYFVVGYPNFMFADTLSPLALTQSVAEFVGQISTPPAGRPRSSIATQMANVAAYEYDGYGGYGGALPPDFGYGTAGTPGAPEEDLFLYRMKDVSLKKGERAYYTVFSAEVPYEHVYEWEIPDTSNVQASGYLDANRRSTEDALEDQVWHKLKLTNETDYPWTTAPGLAMSGGNPLAQDVLSYTPKGASGNLKLTIATDIRAQKSESETTREKEALRTHGYVFDRVTADGELKIKNFKSKDVTLVVKKTVTGEVAKASDDGKVTKSAEGIKAVNPISRIAWEIPLKAGEEKIITYTYWAYVRY